MSTEQLYKRAERADDLSDLDLKDADMYQIAQAIYDSWFPGTNVEPSDLSYYDSHRKRAIRMLAPFREKIKGCFDAAKMTFKPADVEWMGHANVGMYLSALLESTAVDSMLINNHTPSIDIDDLGGKTVEILPGSSVGTVAFNNGTVINRGHVFDVMVRGPATFINYGYGRLLNAYERSGLIVNFGEADSLGYECDEGVFLNFGELGNRADEETSMGYCCTGGVYVAKTKPKGGCMVRAGGTHYINPEQLAKRLELSALMDRIEEAGKTCDVQKIREYGRKVDENVRKKYVKRKVA